MKKCPWCAEEIQDAAIICRHCGRSISTAPQTIAPAPQVVAPSPAKKKTTCAAWGCLGLLVGVVLLALIGKMVPEPGKPQAVATPPRSATQLLDDVERLRDRGQAKLALKAARELIASHGESQEAASASRLIPELEAAVQRESEEAAARAAEERAAKEKRELGAKWTYQASQDPMTSKVARHARIESENTVTFDFPYQGDQHGALTLRDHPTYGRDVIFSIEKGQILCRSYEDCQIRVRFDDRAPQRWSAVGPADNSSTLIFLRNESRFVQELRKAKTVRLQVPVYQEGEPAFEFHVGGLDWSRYQGK